LVLGAILALVLAPGPGLSGTPLSDAPGVSDSVVSGVNGSHAPGTPRSDAAGVPGPESPDLPPPDVVKSESESADMPVSGAAGATWAGAPTTVLQAGQADGIAVTSMNVEMQSSTPSTVRRLTIDEAVGIALERNHALSAAAKRTEGSKARLRRAVAGFLPVITFGSTYIRAKGGRTFPMHYHPPGRPFEETVFFDVSFIPEKLHETKFQITQPVFTGGRLLGQLKLARADRRFYSSVERSARQDLILEARRNYLEVLKAKEAEKVMVDALELAGENLRAVEKLADLGKAAKSDVLRARVQKATAEQDLLVARNGIRLSLESLSAVLDTDIDEGTELVEVTVEADIRIPPIKDVVALAQEQNPDVDAARRSLQRASAAVGVAKSSFLPTVTVQADYGWTEERYSFEDNAWAVYTILNFDIFRGTDRLAGVSEASAQREEARDLLEDAKRQTVLRAKQAHFSLQEAVGRRRVSEARLADAEEAYRMIRLLYDTELSSQLEVLDAQVSLTSARMEEVASRYDLLMAWDDLRRAMGTVREDM
jgi:outer membrane protein TolC